MTEETKEQWKSRMSWNNYYRFSKSLEANELLQFVHRSSGSWKRSEARVANFLNRGQRGVVKMMHHNLAVEFNSPSPRKGFRILRLFERRSFRFERGLQIGPFWILADIREADINLVIYPGELQNLVGRLSGDEEMLRSGLERTWIEVVNEVWGRDVFGSAENFLATKILQWVSSIQVIHDKKII